MFGLEYHGDTDNISQRQLEFVSEVLNKRGYAEIRVMVSTLGKAGDNYGSYVKRFTVDLEDGKPFKMIGKIAPSGISTGIQSPASDVFKNETLLYTEMLPMFGRLQKSVGIPEEDILRYPLCYDALTEQANEIILLEDLDVKNYVMLEKQQPLSDNVIRIVLKNMANFHSMSYVLKQKDPESFKRYLSSLTNLFTNSEILSKGEMFFHAAIDGIKSIFNDNQYLDVINNVIKNFMHTFLHISKDDLGSKYTVIQHGDLWTNNFMFQMQGDKPVDCIFIDYQMVRESLPVADIHSLIFHCTDYETRSKHYFEWIDYYHTELDRYLDYFGLKVSNVYPRDKYDADLKRYAKPCLGASMMMLNFVLRESEEAVKSTTMFQIMDDTKGDYNEIVSDLGVKNLMIPTLELIKKRVEGLVDSCLEYGYLPPVAEGTSK